MLKPVLKATLVTGALLAVTGARADEISDLKAMMAQMQQQIHDLEAKQTAAGAAGAGGQQAPVVSTVKSLVTGMDLSLYGRADVGFRDSYGFGSDGHPTTTYSLGAGQMTSRLGLTGSYSVSDDFKATFSAEAGVNLFQGVFGGTVNVSNGTQDGTATQSFVVASRGAAGGFASKTYGSVDAGLMYMPTFWVILGADHASAHNYGLSDLSALPVIMRPESLDKYLAAPIGPSATTVPATIASNLPSALQNTTKSGTISSANTSGLGYSGTSGFYENAIRLRTPKFSGMFDGLDAELAYSMGQQAFEPSSFTPFQSDGRAWGGNIEYKTHNLFLGYGHFDYLQVSDTTPAYISKAGSTVNGIVNVAANPAGPNFVSRDHVTDIVGARYHYGDLEIGAAYTLYSVTNAAGYEANAYGFSGAYDITEHHRIEFSGARITTAGVLGIGPYGNGAGTAGTAKNCSYCNGSPASISIGLGYLYNVIPTWSFYVYGNDVQNNKHADLGTQDFRTDIAAGSATLGKSPLEITAGTFFTF